MVKTNWTKATTDANKALMGLLSCIQSGCNAWIEVRKNGDQDYPVEKVNPELDNPFNWEFAYGTPRNEEEMAKHRYLNDTEKDLTYNWTDAFGTPEAIEKYQKTGEVTPGLFNGQGTSCPVRIVDANRYRKEIKGDGYEYNFWAAYWRPKEGIDVYVLDDEIDEVFVICYDNSPENIPDKKDLIRKAGEFLLAYADGLNRTEAAGSESNRGPDEVVGERSLDLTISAKKEGYDVRIYDSQTGSDTQISCEDLPSIGKNTHGNSLMEEIQFWVDSIREEACGGEEE